MILEDTEDGKDQLGHTIRLKKEREDSKVTLGDAEDRKEELGHTTRL